MDQRFESEMGMTAVDDPPVEMPGATGEESDRICIDTIRTLAMDAVQEAGSGHPGTAMALAPIAWVLFTRHLRHDPANPDWIDRDRFVLSAGHAAILQYATLHLTGYDLPLDQIRRFRQTGSITPGHPENFLTPGVETTTGPLGQGVANSVGMAIAEARLAATFNRPGHEIIDHRTYAICSDGDVMEGISHEAASIAGHLALGKLTWIYDDNRITIDGSTDLSFSEDVAARFEAYGWHVQNIGDRTNDLEAIDAALQAATDQLDRPSLIIVRSHIAYGAPNLQDTPEAHGAPLGDEEVRLTKRAYGWPEDERFLVPDEAYARTREIVERGRELESGWRERFETYRSAHVESAEELERWLDGDPPVGWDAAIPTFAPADGPMATRKASGKVLNAFAGRIPWLTGGSADLTGSNNTRVADGGTFSRDERRERNLHWGIREHGMCGAANGMALHGGIRPYAATFFIFTDYCRPSIRLAALMSQPVIYVMTHDSIGLGADGPTHQPVEHLASLRAMPGIRVIRPADANEVAEAWRTAIERADGPNLLVLSRQGLPIFDRDVLASAEGLRNGAYVLSPERGSAADLILISSGSEVRLAVEAQQRLQDVGIDARVVSMPCWELFREQPADYRDEVLPPATNARLSIEAGATLGWREWVGDGGDSMGIGRFGASASAEDNFRNFGLTVDDVVARATAMVRGEAAPSTGPPADGPHG